MKESELELPVGCTVNVEMFYHMEITGPYERQEDTCRGLNGLGWSITYIQPRVDRRTFPMNDDSKFLIRAEKKVIS